MGGGGSAVPSDTYEVLLTGEAEDNYFSTLGKGFRGLKIMFEGARAPPLAPM